MLDSLILPSHSYNSELFAIPFPDSMYSAGTIRIKKTLVSGIKFNAKYLFNQRVYSQCEFVVANRHKDELMKFIQQQNTELTVTVTKIRRKYLIIVTE